MRELRAHGKMVPVGGRAFEILEALATAPGQLVTKDELFRQVWPGAVVEDNTLQVHISAIRKALGEDRGLLKTASRTRLSAPGQLERSGTERSGEAAGAQTGLGGRRAIRDQLSLGGGSPDRAGDGDRAPAATC